VCRPQAIGWLSSIIPFIGDDRGSVAVVDRAGNTKTLTREWGSTLGLAWSRDGNEVWFSEEDSRGAQVMAVTLSGRERVIAGDAGRFMLQDISRTGQALITHEAQHCELRVTLPDGSGERNLFVAQPLRGDVPERRWQEHFVQRVR